MKSRNKLVTLYIKSCAWGFAAAAVFVGLILWSGIGGIGQMVAHSPDGWLALLMLFMFNGIVFSGVQFGIAIMAMAERDDTPRGGRRGPVGPLTRAAMPVPIPVRDAPPSERRR